jgi:hypothetical protein
MECGHAYDVAEFRRLQARLSDLWPAMMMRTSEPRVVVVVSSITVNALPDHVYAVIPAYEERYLFYVFTAARARKSRVIYVTSQPIPERVVDYYMHLIPGVSAEELRQRVTLLSVGDWSRRPLVEKILERPRLLQRIRTLISDPARGVLLPFIATESEAQLALRLGIPMYAPDPGLAALGTKSGSRRVFAAAGVPHPRGVEGLRDRGDLVDALVDLQRRLPVAEAIVKLDFLGGGLGNASVRLDGASDRAEVERRVDKLRPEDASLGAEAFLALLTDGGIVEERLCSQDLRSPSVQLRASPMGGVEVLSTHDQLLGGSGGQTFLGCTFPAEAAYRPTITVHARAIGEELARLGVVGRFGVDFVTPRTAASDGSWDAHAIEINLRNGGTTHPALTMLALTDGAYDESSGEFLADGAAKHYVATDHLEHPAYRALTPDDALDVLLERGLSWNPGRRVGVAFHMMSAIAVAGRLGLTAIGDSMDEARGLYAAAQDALSEAADLAPEHRPALPW